MRSSDLRKHKRPFWNPIIREPILRVLSWLRWKLSVHTPGNLSRRIAGTGSGVPSCWRRTMRRTVFPGASRISTTGLVTRRQGRNCGRSGTASTGAVAGCGSQAPWPADWPGSCGGSRQDPCGDDHLVAVAVCPADHIASGMGPPLASQKVLENDLSGNTTRHHGCFPDLGTGVLIQTRFSSDGFTLC